MKSGSSARREQLVLPAVGHVATVAWRRHTRDGEGSVGFGVDVSRLRWRVMCLLGDMPFEARQSKVDGF